MPTGVLSRTLPMSHNLAFLSTPHRVMDTKRAGTRPDVSSDESNRSERPTGGFLALNAISVQQPAPCVNLTTSLGIHTSVPKHRNNRR